MVAIEILRAKKKTLESMDPLLFVVLQSSFKINYSLLSLSIHGIFIPHEFSLKPLDSRLSEKVLHVEEKSSRLSEAILA